MGTEIFYLRACLVTTNCALELGGHGVDLLLKEYIGLSRVRIKKRECFSLFLVIKKHYWSQEIEVSSAPGVVYKHISRGQFIVRFSACFPRIERYNTILCYSAQIN